ncbi:hypothetical protein P4O66_001163 [Electrophorus voltai]|uniref:CS domain-containing protein n=1 Tax=Electrophorus voltai TaxID=2609070 RepID=A0AAD8ZAP3_9TELE|nr:hypothetical protein P4O66_001163 [Electrophorus voltai]
MKDAVPSQYGTDDASVRGIKKMPCPGLDALTPLILPACFNVPVAPYPYYLKLGTGVMIMRDQTKPFDCGTAPDSMITPAFELSQDSDYLTLVIRVPYTRTSEFDICIDGSDFKFYAKPYFLRLNLPGRIVQDGREKASFDIDKGACGGSEAGQEYEEEEFDWQVEQEMYVAPSVEDLQKLQKYGFGNLRTAVFSRLQTAIFLLSPHGRLLSAIQEELSDVIDVGDPDNSTPTARRRDRLDAETSVFCADHYLMKRFPCSPVPRSKEPIKTHIIPCRAMAFGSGRGSGSEHGPASGDVARLPRPPQESRRSSVAVAAAPRRTSGGVCVDYKKAEWDSELAGGIARYTASITSATYPTAKLSQALPLP